MNMPSGRRLSIVFMEETIILLKSLMFSLMHCSICISCVLNIKKVCRTCTFVLSADVCSEYFLYEQRYRFGDEPVICLVRGCLDTICPYFLIYGFK